MSPGAVPISSPALRNPGLKEGLFFAVPRLNPMGHILAGGSGDSNKLMLYLEDGSDQQGPWARMEKNPEL